MKKLLPFQKKLLTNYAISLGILLVCAIYLNATIAMYERNGWDYFVFSKSVVFVIPTTLAITMLLMRKINLSSYPNANESNAKKGKTILFVIALILNAFLLFAVAHLGAKLYNVHGPKQEQVVVEGNIVSTYNMSAIKAKRKRKRTVTVFDNAQRREIKFSTKSKFESNIYFKDTFTRGSLGFLYKKR